MYSDIPRTYLETIGILERRIRSTINTPHKKKKKERKEIRSYRLGLRFIR